jgi:hypothetical protein
MSGLVYTVGKRLEHIEQGQWKAQRRSGPFTEDKFSAPRRNLIQMQWP